MKKFIKILSLCLAALIFSMSFVACADDGDETPTGSSDTGNSENESDTDLAPSVDKNNYDAEFSIMGMGDIFREEYFYAEENNYNEMTDAVYLRQENVKDYLGVEIIYTNATDFQTYATEFKTSVSTGSEQYHLCLTHANVGVWDLISSNALYDYNNLPGINLDADYWNKEMMEEAAYKDQMFLGYSDYALASTYIIAFNKTIYETEVAENIESSLYDMVNNYEWTLDQMISISSMVSEDLDGNGVYDEKDKYGMVGLMWVPMCGFLQASNMNVMERDNSGNYVLTINNEKTIDLIEKLDAFVDADYTYLYFHTVPEDQRVDFKDGTALFELRDTYTFIDLKESGIKFGVLPYPMYDTAQKDVGYRHLSWNGWMAVAADISDPDMVGDTLEMLSYYSAPVTTAFYENLLGAKVSDAPEDTEILDLVWGSLVTDLGMVYSTLDMGIDAMLYAIPRCINENAAFTRYYAQNGTKAQKVIDRQLNS